MIRRISILFCIKFPTSKKIHEQIPHFLHRRPGHLNLEANEFLFYNSCLIFKCMEFRVHKHIIFHSR